MIPLDISDVGGGLVEVMLTVTDHPTEVVVRLQGRPEDEWHPGVDVLVSDSTTRTRGFVFRAQGEKRYNLEVKPIGTPEAGRTASYTVSWTYKPNVDCYEHNDSVATAKRIPLDVPIEAYAHAGIIEGDGILVGPGLLDFYKFVLDEPTTVQLRATKPSATALTFELWDPTTNGPLGGTDMLAAGGVETSSDEVELPAGTHYVRVNTFASQPSSMTLDETMPADWNKPYSFTVKRVRVSAEGGTTVECTPAATPAPQNDNECTPYTPTQLAGSHNGLWADDADVVSIPMHVTDPGGGLIRVTLTASHPTSTLFRRQGAPTEEEHFGVDVLVSDEVSTRSFVFRAQGRYSYNLFVEPVGQPEPGATAYYQVDWNYEPDVDCYEDNDTVARARRIPLDKPIQAYAHAGVIEGDGILVGPSILDFYKFELPSAKRVMLSARKPSDTALTFELWDPVSGGALASTDMLAGAHVDSTSEEIELPAGTHYVRVGTFASQPSTQSTETPFPADWNQPYSLTVKTR